MTEQEAEAEAWEARLTRIWTPETSKWDEGWLYHMELGIDPYFEHQLYLDVSFGEAGALQHYTKLYNHRLLLVCRRRFNWNWHFELDDVRAPCFSWPEPKQTCISQWVSTFRRGCWLSGCDIEASAHEKMEWMQGYTREELEAWNLKM